MQRTHYPVIVIGGGTMGLAAAWELGKRDVACLVLEQFGIVHDQGSHSGQTRIIRHAYAESPDYVPIVQRADDLFLLLEEETGSNVLYRTGGLDLAGPGSNHAQAARESAERWDVPFEWLDGAEIRQRFPAWRVPDDWVACYSPNSGFLQPMRRSRRWRLQRRNAASRSESTHQWSIGGLIATGTPLSKPAMSCSRPIS